jgi:hypothetical protein
MSDCHFRENVVEPGDDCAGGYGGGLSVSMISFPAAEATISRCSFVANRAAYGAGIANSGLLNAFNSEFVANDTENLKAGDWECYAGLGAAVHNLGTANVANCLFDGNRSDQAGAIASYSYRGAGSVTLSNSTLTSNTSYADAAVMTYGSAAFIRNSVLWHNVSALQTGEAAQLDTATLVHHSIIDGWSGALGGVGNSGDDPLFRDPLGPDGQPGTADDDLHLRPRSPAINAGDSAALPPDTADLDNDGDTAEPLPLDLDGRPRVAGRNVDIGPYESPALAGPRAAHPQP